MDSKSANEVIKTTYPNCHYREVDGNPNMLGWYLFNVEGLLVWVTKEGECVEETSVDLTHLENNL